MDPLLEDTEQHIRRRPVAPRPSWPRRVGTLGLWLLTEIPAYRAGLLVGYAFAVYIGISALIAGVPTFVVTAPDGWTPVWAWLIVIAGPIGLAGVVLDTEAFRRVELLGVTILAGGLTMYAGSMLFLAYGAGDDMRVTGGAGFAALAAQHLVRMVWLIVQVVGPAVKKRKQAAHGG